jgi:hypothetical protein
MVTILDQILRQLLNRKKDKESIQKNNKLEFSKIKQLIHTLNGGKLYRVL